MIDIKTQTAIEAMKIGGHMLALALQESLDAIKPGVTELELDSIAEKAIRKLGGEPGFMKVPRYHHTLCTCVNEVIVHGIPTKRVLEVGDVICLDGGVFYQGLHTDMAETVVVGGEETVTKEVRDFLEAGRKALQAGIKQAKGGNHVGHISKAIQDIVEPTYSIVRSLVGHGVGKQLHEAPEVPGFLEGKIEQTPKLIPGMTIAVEVIYNMGGPDVMYANGDGWTIKSADDSLTAVFERSILITEGDPVMLTK